jgi:hypothetical protein
MPSDWEGRTVPTFTTTLTGASDINATGIAIPPAVIEGLNAGKRPKVTVTINGSAYRTTVAVMGGAFMVPVAAEQRVRSGIKAGDVIEVTVELDTAPREVTAPPDLVAALETADARAAWDRLSFTHKKEHVRDIEAAKAAETRQRRIDKAVAMALTKKT